jgi:hypothetical protein
MIDRQGAPCRIELATSAPPTSSPLGLLRPNLGHFVLGGQHVFYPNWQIAHALAGRVEDRIGDGGSHANERNLADALDAED